MRYRKYKKNEVMFNICGTQHFGKLKSLIENANSRGARGYYEFLKLIYLLEYLVMHIMIRQ